MAPHKIPLSRLGKQLGHIDDVFGERLVELAPLDLAEERGADVHPLRELPQREGWIALALRLAQRGIRFPMMDYRPLSP